MSLGHGANRRPPHKDEQCDDRPPQRCALDAPPSSTGNMDLRLVPRPAQARHLIRIETMNMCSFERSAPRPEHKGNLVVSKRLNRTQLFAQVNHVVRGDIVWKFTLQQAA